MTDWAARIAKLDEAITSGVRTVESDGERITYDSVPEMLKARDFAQAQLLATASGSQRPATTVAVYDPD